MGEGETAQSLSGSSRHLMKCCLLVAACAVPASVLLLVIFLNSPPAPALLSRILTDYLRQPVRVAALRTDGAAVSLTGVALANPSAAASGDLCRVDELTIAPDWGKILTGKRSLRLLAIRGLRVDLRRNGAGVWNFSGLQRQFAARKGSGEALFIKSLVVSGGTVLVNGQGVKDVSLRLSNLTTKGTNSARLELTCDDPAGNRYSLTGLVSPGDRPSLDLLLSAPSLSLKEMPGLRGNPAARDAGGALRLAAVLRGGRLRIRGTAEFNRVSLPVAGGRTVPTFGKVQLSADYDGTADRARLESLTLMLNNAVAARAAASVDGLRKDRRFLIDLDLNQTDLAPLNVLLPEKERQTTRFGGTLGNGGIHLAGDCASGVNSVRGTLLLRDAWLKRSDRSVFAGLSATLALSGAPSALVVRGRVSCRQPGGKTMLESLDAPFSVTLSGRFKPIRAQAPNLAARIMGCAVSGKLGFNAAAPAPFSGALRLSAPSFSRLDSLVGVSGLKLESGSAIATVEGAGQGARDFRATAAVRLAGVRGTRNAARFGMADVLVDARLARRGGILSADGSSRLSGLNLDGRRGEARFAYRVADRVVFLNDGVFLSDGLSFRFQRVAARLPTGESRGGTVGYPLSADISGGAIRYRDADLDGLSGKVRARLLSDSRGKWLEGSSEIVPGRVSWRGTPVASPVAQVTFSRMGASGRLGGTLLGGAFDGAVVFNPFDPARGGTFRASVKGARMASLGGLLPRGDPAALAGGVLDGTCSGAFSATGGVACRFGARGGDIELSGGSRILISGAGFSLDGTLSRERLALEKARVTAGSGVTLTLGGELADPFTPNRRGRFTFDFPETPVNTVVDRFVNVLPRLIQEATVDGTVSTSGSLVVKEGRQLLEGGVRFRNLMLDAPSQKLKVTEVNGTFPFSLDLSGKMPGHLPETEEFTRENYPLLLVALRKSSGAAQGMSVGGVVFGPLELGETRLEVNAANGVTRITGLRSSFYEGRLFGSGYVTLAKGLSYRGDLLINDLSLRLLCAAIPNIRDYISGRVDGVISLGGTGRGLSGLSGFSELWAREGGGEKMLVSRVFLQKLSGKNLSGFFFRQDRPFDQAEIVAALENGYLTFDNLDISHTNIFGVRDLSVTIAPSQNRIALDHLMNSIIQASARGKAAAGGGGTETQSAEPEFKWQE